LEFPSESTSTLLARLGLINRRFSPLLSALPFLKYTSPTFPPPPPPCRLPSPRSFSISDLQEVLDSCIIPPAVNQILLNPNVYEKTAPLLEFMAEKNIVAEGYSPLRPLREDRPGPIVKVVEQIAAKKGCNPEQVMLAWVKTKG